MTEQGYLRPVWAEINLDHLIFNVNQIRHIIGKHVKLLAVVKGDAYGTGISGIVPALLSQGVDMFGVGILDEALQLRQMGVMLPVLVFGYTPFSYSGLLVAYDISQTVYCYEQAAALSAAAIKSYKTARIHLEVDTGMGRLGFSLDNGAVRVIKDIAALPGIQIEGIYTHCPYTNEVAGSGVQFTHDQFNAFNCFCDRLKACGINIPLQHVCNSLGILHYPDMHMNMVRAGIILYGSYPHFQQVLSLKPVLSLKSQIGFVKRIGPGRNVSYGHTYTTGRETLVATIPLGYADGYSRMLTNKSCVLIGGRRAPVIGTICMDQCMVDVTELGEECLIGDEVVLIGKQGSEEITVEELSTLGCGFINYEYLVQISHRVPRVYLQKGKVVHRT